MPNRYRWLAPPAISELIAAELDAARTAAEPWAPLERAHILSQPWAWPHTRVHAAMFATAIRQRDPQETLGQFVRIIVAAPGSLTGRYPIGNTGRTTMALTETAPVPDELGEMLEQALG